MKHTIISATLLLLSFVELNAQSFSPLVLEYTPIRTNSEVNHNGKVQLSIPFIRKPSTKALGSVEYRFANFNGSVPFNDHQFYQLNLRLMLTRKINEKWGTMIIAVPSIASATGNVSGESFIWLNGVRFSHKKNDHWTTHFGLLYTYRFSNNVLIPVGGFVWKPNPKYELTLNFPFKMQSLWHLSPRFETGPHFTGDRLTAYMPHENDSDYFWFSEQNLGWITSFNIVKRWWLKVDIGYSIKRDIKTFETPEHPVWSFGPKFLNASLNPVSEYSEKGMYVNFSLSYRLNRNRSK